MQRLLSRTQLFPQTTRTLRACTFLALFCLVLMPLISLPAEEEDHPEKTDSQKLSAEQLEFFETEIRPVLVNQCYDCHSHAATIEGGLQLDFREALIKGGDSGTLFNFKEPEKSLLIKVLRHELEGLEMPQGEDPLNPETIAHFVTWIKMGAPDPREKPTGVETTTNSWETTFNERKQWWSFQPIRTIGVPHVEGTSSKHPIDQFVQQKLNEADLPAAAIAEKRTLIRRLSFVLTGLPPTPEEIEFFLEDESPDAYEKLVYGYLSSKRFGERWARHWMDWIRYTDTHGSEGDPAIPYAYRYRDYLIRALNDDVPYDQLVKEHIAGDLLAEPRINAELGINESAIGPAHWRMVFHGFAPTDALEEKVRFTDDQINVYSKAFLGLTVSCARCHNHKFDAISQEDFYALYGILDSNRPSTNDVNLPELQQKFQPELSKLKAEIKTELINQWEKEAEQLSMRLTENDFQQQKTKDRRELLHLWKELLTSNGKENFQDAWQKIVVGWKSEQNHIKRHEARNYYQRWRFNNDQTYDLWHRDGNGLTDTPSQAGEFSITSAGENLVTGIFPSGVYSNRLSEKHRAVLSSPRFNLNEEYNVWFRTVGDQGALNRYAVQHYPRSGTVYPVHRMNKGEWHWSQFNLDYWNGDDIHLEVTTSEDQPILVEGKNRSWFGLREVVVWKKGTEAPPAYDLEYLTPLFDELSEKDVNSPADIATALEQATQRAIQNWRTNQLTDAQAVFLDHLLEASLLSNRATNEKLKQLFTAYRELEEQVPIPTRVPGLLETDVVNQPLMVRGNHKQLNEEVPRHFLSAIEETPYDANDSGRLELAEDTVRPDNPFTSRVIVNRLWHYVFGAGLVRTPDNFGQLGEQPTHPELLDFLANRLREEGWSLKKMIRFMVTSETFQRSTDHTAQIHEQDPENRLWSHANLRRLEAEAIRDTLLAVSGQLDLKMYGPGYKPNSGAEQRSVYGYIQRNNLEKLLTTFDAPTPFATKGRRDVTNVPGQSLTLLNDPFIVDCATDWVRMLRKEYPDQSEKERIQLMFEQGLGRQPTEKEAQQAHVFLAQLGKEYTDLRADFVLLAQQERDVEKQIESILEPARKKLLPDQGNGEDLTGLPTPVAQWKFDEHADDELLGLKGKLNGSARLEEGALVLDGAGHLSSEAVPTRTMAKTLEAWVQLDNLDQQGGGVITLQRTDGYLFDSIVIGEIRPGHWIAGSNFHTRTLDFKGTPEADAVSNPVHIAISYDEQGNIQCFRNGVPYGESIRKASVQPFEADESNFLFGLRHAPAGGNRFLRGRIYEARFYDRALTAEELEVSSRSLGQFASPEKVRAELSAEQQTKLASYETKLKEIQKQRQSLGTEPKPEQAWIDLGHAIFNLKNFIYYE